MAFAGSATLYDPAKPEGGRSDSGARISYVDQHAIFIIDMSSSVNIIEQRVMFKGLYDAFTSQEMLRNHFNSGTRYAISFIFFADHARAYPTTFTIGTPQGAVAMAEEVLWDPVKGRLPTVIPAVGSNTNMVPAFMKAVEIYQREAEIGIASTRRAVIVLADDAPNDKDDIRRWSAYLSTTYGATVYGIPVSAVDSSAEKPPSQASFDLEQALSEFFTTAIPTPRGTIYTLDHGLKLPLKSGRSLPLPATKPGHFKPIIAEALNLAVS